MTGSPIGAEPSYALARPGRRIKPGVHGRGNAKNQGFLAEPCRVLSPSFKAREALVYAALRAFLRARLRGRAHGLFGKLNVEHIARRRPSSPACGAPQAAPDLPTARASWYTMYWFRLTPSSRALSARARWRDFGARTRMRPL